MDVVQDWVAYLLGDHEALRTYSPYLRQIYGLVWKAKSYVYPLLDQVARKPDLATIALLIVIIFVSLKLLNMLLQTVLFWLRLAMRMVFWGGLAAIGIWMYTRRAEGVLEDVNFWWQSWNNEHDYWREREKMARAAKGQAYRMGNAGRGGGWR